MRDARADSSRWWILLRAATNKWTYGKHWRLTGSVNRSRAHRTSHTKMCRVRGDFPLARVKSICGKHCTTWNVFHNWFIIHSICCSLHVALIPQMIVMWWPNMHLFTHLRMSSRLSRRSYQSLNEHLSLSLTSSQTKMQVQTAKKRTKKRKSLPKTGGRRVH